MDGKKAEEILGKDVGYTYNDIIMLPRHIDFGTESVIYDRL